MSAKIVFSNMPKSTILESHVLDELSKALEGHVGGAGYKTRIKLEMENSPFQAGLDSFLVLVNLKIKGLRPIVLKKHGESMYQVIRDSMDSLRNALAKAHKVRKERSHRRLVKRSQRKLYEELLGLRSPTAQI